MVEMMQCENNTLNLAQLLHMSVIGRLWNVTRKSKPVSWSWMKIASLDPRSGHSNWTDKPKPCG